jgi:hypothetical protein
MKRQPLGYSIAAIFLTLLVAIPSGYWYTNQVQRESERRHQQLVRESERKWCDLLDILTGGPSPETDRGRVIADLMRTLREQFGC